MTSSASTASEGVVKRACNGRILLEQVLGLLESVQRLPSSSNARPSGMPREPALDLITTFGSRGSAPARGRGRRWYHRLRGVGAASGRESEEQGERSLEN